MGPDPILELGVMDGDPDQQFSQILAVLELDDGRIVVADRQAPEGALRLFAADGTFLDRSLPQGEGPMEVQAVRWAGFVDGGIGVWDASLQPPSVMDVEEGFAWRGSRPLNLAHPDPPDPDPDTQLMLSMAGELVGVLGDGSFVGIPAQEIIVPDITAGQTTPPPTPFPSHVVLRVHDDRILHGVDTEGHGIEILDGEGRVQERLEWAGGDRTVTPELQRAWLDHAEEDEAAFPERYAPFRSLVVADDGHYWIRGETLPGVAGFWFVLDPDGTYRGRVDAPDDFDVQYVRRYPIQ